MHHRLLHMESVPLAEMLQYVAEVVVVGGEVVKREPPEVRAQRGAKGINVGTTLVESE